MARNWVEDGHYGHLLDGEPVPAGILHTGIPAVAPIALSLRVFGMGLWQARLPGAIYTLGGLALICYLAGYLYDRRIAIVTLVVAHLLNPHPDLHPVLLGRQALGEMPALFYLLAGFAFFVRARQRPRVFTPVAILLWALSLRTKPQILPFLAIGLGAALGMAVLRRCWRTAWILAAGLVGALVTNGLLARGSDILFKSLLFAPSSGQAIYGWLGNPSYLFTYVLVPDRPARMRALVQVLLRGIPQVLGMGYAGYSFVKNRHRIDMNTSRDAARLALWAMGASWLCWYVLCSIGWPRYLFPAMFVGSIFTAFFLQDAVGASSFLGLLRRGAKVLKQRPLTLPGAAILLAAVVMPAMFLTSLQMLYYSFVVYHDDSLLETAHFLNTATRPDALIETYDAELHFLLERPYHYPPDPVETQLNRRTFLGLNIEIEYDPLSSDPDYLVVGPITRMWGLYEPVLDLGEFELVHDNARYQVYRRVRSP